MSTNIEDLRCPNCGGKMLEGRKSWFCENWRSGCAGRVWKESFGHRFTADEIAALLGGERIGPLDLTSRAGKHFRAALEFDKLDGRVHAVFEEHKAEPA